MRESLAAIALALTLAGGDDPEQACIPGETNVCVFPGGGSGAQKCKPDGSGYGDCAACEAGEVKACLIGSGSGTQTCKADGSGYTACQ